MALPSDYRWIAVGKLVIRNRANSPHYAPTFRIGDLMAALTDRINRADVYRKYSRSSRVMWCSDLAEDDVYYKIIMQIGDKNVTGISFLNFETMASRDIEKGEREGGHYAAHVLIKKVADNFGRHLILIEKVPGIYLSSVKDHLTWVCKNPLYEKQVEDDSGEIKSFRAVFEIIGHQSKTIRDALRTGTLQDIEFIRHEENHADGLDEEPIVDEIIHEARWQVRKRVTEDQARTIFGGFGDFLRGFRRGPDDTQIFVRIKTANGQIKRTEVDYNEGEVLEQAFVQNEIVNNFDPPLTQRYNAFRHDLIGKMIEIASNAGD